MPAIIEVGDLVRSKDGMVEGQLYYLHDPKRKEDVTARGVCFRYDDDKMGTWRNLDSVKLVAALWTDGREHKKRIPFEDLVLVCKRRHCRGCKAAYWLADKRAVYCSTKCRKKNSRVYVCCEKCSSKFERKRTNQRFCGRTCKETAARRRSRQPEIQRLGGTCSVCESAEKLRIVDGLDLLCGKHYIERNQRAYRERTGVTKTGKDQLSAFNRFVKVTLLAIEGLDFDEAEEYLANVCARLNPKQAEYLASRIRLSSKGGISQTL